MQQCLFCDLEEYIRKSEESHFRLFYQSILKWLGLFSKSNSQKHKEDLYLVEPCNLVFYFLSQSTPDGPTQMVEFTQLISHT